MASAADNWLGWGSKDAWLVEHNKTLQPKEQAAPTPTDPYSGGNYYDTAYNKKYPTTKPTWEESYNANQDWYTRKGLLKDTTLTDKGFSYFEGSADTTQEALRKSGYITAGEAGSTLASGQNAWYLPGQKEAATGGGSSAPSAGGGTATASAPVAAPAVVEPEPFRMTSETGSSIGGDITATLGSVGKSPYDTAAKGLKGLTTPTGKTPVDKDKDLERKKFGQGLFKVGVNLPGSGTGVQV